MKPTNENKVIWPWQYNHGKANKWNITDRWRRKKTKKRALLSAIKNKIETNGEILRTYEMPCSKCSCEKAVELEEIGYINGAMHVRCKRCGYIQQMPELPNN